MVADKGKKPKVVDNIDDENDEQIDTELVQSIVKLQDVQDELEKVTALFFFKINLPIFNFFINNPTYPIRLKLSSPIPHKLINLFL